MKQKLLLFAASVMFAISASAQWTKPTVSSFSEMATDGQTVQFLYNVGTQRFLVGANDWNTRASVGEQGDSVKVEALEDGHYAIHAIAALNAGKTAWGYVSCNDWNAMWMDGYLTEGAEVTAYPGTLKWNIKKSGDVYKITSDEMLEAYELGDDATWGVPETFEGAATTRLYIYDPTQTYTKVVDEEEFPGTPCFEGNFYDEWKFVSLADYETYNAKAAAYLAAESLKAAMDKAEAENPGIDLSAQKAVYNNTASTVEELKAAEAGVAAAIVDFLKGQASAANPVDFSSSIVNATFDEVGNFDGWSGTAFGAGGTTSTNAEHYGHTFDTYQDILNLPGGVYMVAVNAYTRRESASVDYNQWVAGTPAETKVYLKGATNGTFSTPIKHVSAGGSIDAPVGGAAVTEVIFTDEDGVEHTLYCPNTMESANNYFHDGTNRYRSEAYGAIADGDTLRLGVINTSSSTSCWSIFDDFQLFYFGDGADAYHLWAGKVAENSAIEFKTYYGAPEKALYDNAMETLKNSSSAEEIMSAIASMETVSDTVATSIKNYALYVDALNDALEALTDMEESDIQAPEVDLLADYLQASADDNQDFEDVFPNGVANYILNLEAGEIEGKLSAAEIAAETEYVQNLVKTAYEKGMVPGSDVTNLLTNASFKNGFTGWTNSSGGDVVGNVGGLAAFPDVECYGTIVDCQQTVKAQPGVYGISVKAFERPAANGSFTGDEESITYLFMNQFQTPVQNICKDAILDEDAEDKVNCYKGDGGGGWPYDYQTDYGWIPNSVDGASYAFMADRYDQSCYGLVGDDGVMTIGLTSNGKTVHWVLWADFRLTFMGKDPEALTSIIDYYVEQAQEISGAGNPEQNALDKAVEDAEAAQETGEGNAMYEALFTLYDAYNAAKESVELYEQAETLLINLENAMGDYTDSASEVAKAEAQDILNNTASDIYDRQYSIDQLNTAIADIEKAIAKLKVPNLSYASDENPVDITSVIVNPTYENANSEGWSGSVPSHSGYNRKDMVEYWHASCNQYQVLRCLPEGTYELSVHAYNRYNDNAQTDYNEFSAGRKDEVQTGLVYIIKNDNETSIPVRMISEGARESAADMSAGSTSTITTADGRTLYTPNNMQAAGQLFEATDENGNPLSDELNYVNRIVFKLTQETDVTIGIKNSVTNSWLIWDDWNLLYFGKNSSKVPTGDGLSGDVNEDGKVDINDVVAIINVMAGTANWPNANVNGEGDVDINDVVAVINIMAGK